MRDNSIQELKEITDVRDAGWSKPAARSTGCGRMAASACSSTTPHSGLRQSWYDMRLACGHNPRRVRLGDASVSIREQRNSIPAVGGTCLVILLAVLIIGKAPAVIIACLISAVIATGLGYWINRYTKLSLHSATIAGCPAVLLWTFPLIGVIMVAFTPSVCWACIRLKHHTPLKSSMVGVLLRFQLSLFFA